MKKKILAFVLLCIVSFSSLLGCQKKDENSIEKLTLNGQEIVLKVGEVTYTADDLFGELLNTQNGAEVAFSKIFKIVVQTATPVDANMQAGLDLQFDKWKTSVSNYQKEKSIKYEEAEKTKLAEYGVATTDELKEQFKYEAQLKKLSTIYWRENKTAYMDEYIENRLLYYIRHILVSVSKTDSKQDQFYVSIQASAAEKLYKVYKMIADGNSFASVAYLLPSDDPGSASNGGAYKMDITTSFVHEFKYGVMAYDAFANAESLDGYPEELQDLYGNGFDAIPASYIVQLYEKKDDSYLFNPSDLDTTLKTYPRNIIFNTLFNNPGVSLITYDIDIPEGEEAPSNTRVVDYVKGEDGQKTSARVLTDENGTPIIVTRGMSGIHFIVIDKSPVKDLEDAQKYFSIDPDGEDEYTSYAEEKETVSAKNEVIKDLEKFAKAYAKKGIEGNEKVAEDDAYLDFDMFEHYIDKTYNDKKIEIVNKIVKDIIEKYIAEKRNYAEVNYNEEINGQWNSYINKVKSSRSDFVKARKVPLVCLEYVSDTNQNCTYTYEGGFTVVDLGG